jgi:hypothetical protein
MRLRAPSNSRGAVANEERPHTSLGHASERIGAHPAAHPKGNDWSGRFPLVVEAEPPWLKGPWSALERASGILWGYQCSAPSALLAMMETLRDPRPQNCEPLDLDGAPLHLGCRLFFSSRFTQLSIRFFPLTEGVFS